MNLCYKNAITLNPSSSTLLPMDSYRLSQNWFYCLVAYSYWFLVYLNNTLATYYNSCNDDTIPMHHQMFMTTLHHVAVPRQPLSDPETPWQPGKALHYDKYVPWQPRKLAQLGWNLESRVEETCISSPLLLGKEVTKVILSHLSMILSRTSSDLWM